MDRAALPETTDEPHARPLGEGDPRVVRLSLDAGERVPSHTHPDRRVVFHVLSGAVELTLDDRTHGLDAGDVVRFDGRREVSPAATADSEALLVLAERC